MAFLQDKEIAMLKAEIKDLKENLTLKENLLTLEQCMREVNTKSK